MRETKRERERVAGVRRAAAQRRRRCGGGDGGDDGGIFFGGEKLRPSEFDEDRSLVISYSFGSDSSKRL
ncbi:hypothetical protein HanIR_Chr09g0407071 [Helianthus annuus]|nr:hypothetical protein HanIR_Chr09g0407071 [Helianthus annuus]